LNVKNRTESYLAPLKSLITEKGTRYMLLVAFIWSITSNLDKIGVNASSSVFWAFAVNAFIAILMLLILVFQRNVKLCFTTRNLRILSLIGIMNSLMFVSQMTALKFIIVPYVISIKRMSAVLSVFWGALIFKEKETLTRVIAALVMILGVIFILLLN
jgi:uncharacterized membrane protein